MKRTWYAFGGILAAVFLLATVIFQVSAATFDSDIVPETASTYGLGTFSGDWTSINDTIFFDGSNNVGISNSSFSPSARLHVRGDVRVTNGDIYIDSSSRGVILVSLSGSCWRLAVDNAGVLSSATTTCP